jgi:hypothetical protein
MYCKFCGSQIDRDSTFCSNCGKKISYEPIKVKFSDKRIKANNTLDALSSSIEIYNLPNPKLDRDNVYNIIFGLLIIFIGTWLEAYNYDDDNLFYYVMTVISIFLTVLFQDSIKKRNRDQLGWSVLMLLFLPLFWILIGIVNAKPFDNSLKWTKNRKAEIIAYLKFLQENEDWIISVNYCSQVLKYHKSPEFIFSRASSLYHLREFELAKKDLTYLLEDTDYKERAGFCRINYCNIVNL